jgi:hypothetical protein
MHNLDLGQALSVSLFFLGGDSFIDRVSTSTGGDAYSHRCPLPATNNITIGELLLYGSIS